MSMLRRDPDVDRPRLAAVDPHAGQRGGYDDGGARDEFHLLDYWHIVWHYRWSILALALIAGAIGVLSAAKSVPMYKAEMRLLVKYNQPTMPDVQQFESSPLYWYFYETQIDIIKSRAVAERLADRLIREDPRLGKSSVKSTGDTENTQGAISGWLAEAKSWVKSWMTLLPEEWRSTPATDVAPASPREALVDRILGGVDVGGGKETEVLQVRYVSPDPEFAARVANGLADAYIEFGLDSRVETMQQATSWLGQRIKDLKLKLERSEQTLQEFQSVEGLVDTENREKIIGAKLGTLTAELIRAQAARSQAEARYRQVQAFLAGTSADTSILSILQSPLVVEAHRVKVERERRVSELDERYGPKHPKMRAAITDLQQSEQRLDIEIQKAADAIRKEFEIARTQEQDLRAIIEAQQVEMRTLSGKAFSLAKLEREVESNRQLYETFVTRAKEADIANEYDASNVRVIDRAKVPAAPFKPNKQRMVLTALMLGLVFGVLLAILRARLDDTVKVREDVENRLGLPLLGMLQRLKLGRREQILPEQYVLANPRTPFAEAINDIRTAILYSDVDNPPKAILVTSSVAEEGKTTLATNLALAFRKRGTCLLLEADLRKGRLAEVFNVPAGHPGISEVILGESALDSAIVNHPEAKNLYLLCAGANPPNPLEILSSKKFARALDELRRKFDYIVIDGPPLLPVSDSVILGHLCDAVVFTVQGQHTAIGTVEESLKRLASGRIRPTGVVLQQVDMDALKRYSTGYRGMYRSYYSYQHQRTA